MGRAFNCWKRTPPGDAASCLAESTLHRPPSERIEFVAETSEHNPGIFKEGFFVNSRGLQLRVYAATQVQQPKGVVVFHHGIRVHALYELLTYTAPGGRRTGLKGSIAELLLDEGYALYAYDCEGHGLSESQVDQQRHFFRSAWDLAEDLAQFASVVRREHPGLHVFAAGCSMGSGICVGTAIRHPTLFDGLVLASPMISIERIKNKGFNRILRPVAPSLLNCFPCLETKDIVSMPDHPDKNEAKTYKEDPLTPNKPFMQVRVAFAAMTFCVDLVREIGSLTTPFLTMHAREDPFTDFESTEILMERAASTDKTFLEPPLGSQHALFCEGVCREWTREAVRGWLQARCK